MKRLLHRTAALPLGFFLASVLSPPLHASGPGAEAGFPGTWALKAAKDDVVRKVKGEGWDILGGGGSTVVEGYDLPLEVMTDARRLVVTDDGKTLRVTYPSGRKRTFVTDGTNRYLDDGDGAADVVARRNGGTVTVTSEWRRGYKLREAWEVRSNPRLLVVTGKVRGRESQQYVRTYEPAPPAPPAESAAGPPAGGAGSETPSVAAPSGTPGPGGAAPGSPPVVVDRMSECTIRPARGASPAELSALAKVSQQEAGKKAVASIAPASASDVISSDVEVFERCLAWPFTLRLPAKGGVQEVFVDAGDGTILRSEFVPTGAAREEP